MKNLIHNKHAHKYIGSERGKRGTRKRRTKGILGIFRRDNGQVPSEPPLRLVALLLQRDLHSMRVGTWDSFTHKKEGGSFLLKSEMGLIC